MLGKVVLENTFVANDDFYKTSINTHSLKNGCYLPRTVPEKLPKNDPVVKMNNFLLESGMSNVTLSAF